MNEEREIARFFDCCETSGQRKMNARLSSKARRELIRGLEDKGGLHGKTVLEIGSGPGDLTRRLIRLGAARAVGIDLAEQTLEEARKRASADGLADQVDYRVGNGARDSLGTYDIVVLDKVICCYPNWEELVDNTSAATQGLYGFVIPRSDGLSSFFVRTFIAIQRLALKLKKCGFTPYVHEYSKIDSHLLTRGFRRTRLSRGTIWMTAVYSRM